MNRFDLDKIAQDAATFEGLEQSEITCLVNAVSNKNSGLSREVVLRRLLGAAMRYRASETAAEFFMVYREGGRAPAFKHGDRESADAEARRIARDSGERTYVLAAVASIDALAPPTDEEFRRHAELHGRSGVGLWRFEPTTDGRVMIPSIFGVRVDERGAWSCGHGAIRLHRVSDARGKWTPLDENGKDLEDIPF